MATLPTVTQESIIAEADQRAQTKTAILSQQKTANQDITDSTTQQKKNLIEQNEEVIQRTTITVPAAGLHPGANRDDTQDRLNQANLRDIEQSEERIAKDQRNNVVVTQRQIDTTRARQKVQMRCNHQYDTTNRCVLCNKHRDSHRYDL